MAKKKAKKKTKKKVVKKTTKRCSMCRKPGHNARSHAAALV